MKLKDIEIKVKTEVEFWEQFLKFKGAHISTLPKEDTPNALLPDLQRKVYATALSMPQDVPFDGYAMTELANLLGIKKTVLGTYRREIQKKGWLTKDHRFTTEIQTIRQAYKKEASIGIHSVAFIYKLCIC